MLLPFPAPGTCPEPFPHIDKAGIFLYCVACTHPQTEKRNRELRFDPVTRHEPHRALRHRDVLPDSAELRGVPVRIGPG